MRFKSIETTPNPNSMKLNFHDSFGKPVTYTGKDSEGCPEIVSLLLNIAGIKSIFVCEDFITLNKDPRADWKPLLNEAAALLGCADETNISYDDRRKEAEKAGQVHVFVQTFKGIPLQVKVMDSNGESRVSLDGRFNEAAMCIQVKTKSDFLKDRYWQDWGIRYGAADEISKEVAEQIEGTTDQKALDRLQCKALGEGVEEESGLDSGQLFSQLKSEDWLVRLGAVQELSRCDDAVAVLTGITNDPHPQVRRHLAAALGATGDVQAVPPLCEMLLSDPSVGVRRTAGDALSDIGDKSAEPAVCQALSDSNKLVRWRAARFLFEVGSAASLPSLEKASEDAEYEVRLEVQAAIERIREGADESVPVWKQIVKGKESS